MAYNSQVTRSNVQGLIPETVSDRMLNNLNEQSAALALFPHLPVTNNNQVRLPILNSLPTAYFVSGDTGYKQTTGAAWANKFLNIEEIAAIVPMPENVFDDVENNVWDRIQPLVEQAIARTLDAAIFFNVSKPSSWPNAIVTDAVANAKAVTRGAAGTSAGGVATDLSNVFATLEASGYDVNGILASTTYKGVLRNARNAFGDHLAEVDQNSVWGIPVKYPMRGQWTNTSGNAEAILGDFTQGLIGLRSDVTWKLLTEGVITDNAGSIIYNLPQQDMIAMRVTFRVGFQIANTINYDDASATRYPFAVITHP